MECKKRKEINTGFAFPLAISAYQLTDTYILCGSLFPDFCFQLTFSLC